MQTLSTPLPFAARRHCRREWSFFVAPCEGSFSLNGLILEHGGTLCETTWSKVGY